jgi:hypothetical protein
MQCSFLVSCVLIAPIINVVQIQEFECIQYARIFQMRNRTAVVQLGVLLADVIRPTYIK